MDKKKLYITIHIYESIEETIKLKPKEYKKFYNAYEDKIEKIFEKKGNYYFLKEHKNKKEDNISIYNTLKDTFFSKNKNKYNYRFKDSDNLIEKRDEIEKQLSEEKSDGMKSIDINFFIDYKNDKNKTILINKEDKTKIKLENFIKNELIAKFKSFYNINEKISIHPVSSYLNKSKEFNKDTITTHKKRLESINIVESILILKENSNELDKLNERNTLSKVMILSKLDNLDKEFDFFNQQSSYYELNNISIKKDYIEEKSNELDKPYEKDDSSYKCIGRLNKIKDNEYIFKVILKEKIEYMKKDTINIYIQITNYFGTYFTYKIINKKFTNNFLSKKEDGIISNFEDAATTNSNYMLIGNQNFNKQSSNTSNSMYIIKDIKVSKSNYEEYLYTESKELTMNTFSELIFSDSEMIKFKNYIKSITYEDKDTEMNILTYNINVIKEILFQKDNLLFIKNKYVNIDLIYDSFISNMEDKNKDIKISKNLDTFIKKYNKINEKYKYTFYIELEFSKSKINKVLYNCNLLKNRIKKKINFLMTKGGESKKKKKSKHKTLKKKSIKLKC